MRVFGGHLYFLVLFSFPPDVDRRVVLGKKVGEETEREKPPLVALPYRAQPQRRSAAQWFCVVPRSLVRVHLDFLGEHNRKPKPAKRKVSAFPLDSVKPIGLSVFLP